MVIGTLGNSHGFAWYGEVRQHIYAKNHGGLARIDCAYGAVNTYGGSG